MLGIENRAFHMLGKYYHRAIFMVLYKILLLSLADSLSFIKHLISVFKFHVLNNNEPNE